MRPKGRVLVVDDNQEIVALLRDLLALEGYQVHAAVGDLVLPLARAVRPDLILLDAHMPGQDGAALSRRLRADPATAAIPRVVVTADPDLCARAAEIGAVAVVGKPFELPALLRCVARWAGPGATGTTSLPPPPHPLSYVAGDARMGGSSVTALDTASRRPTGAHSGPLWASGSA